MHKYKIRKFIAMVLVVTALMGAVLAGVTACLPVDHANAQSTTLYESADFVEIHIIMAQLEQENTIFEFTKFPGLVFKDYRTTWGFTGDTVVVRMDHLNTHNRSYWYAQDFYFKQHSAQVVVENPAFRSEWERQSGNE